LYNKEGNPKLREDWGWAEPTPTVAAQGLTLREVIPSELNPVDECLRAGKERQKLMKNVNIATAETPWQNVFPLEKSRPLGAYCYIKK
jgi:hypothetical protein